MKARSLMIFLMLVAWPFAARAEQLTGTILNVDGNRVTLLRSGTNERVDVAVSDAAAVAKLREGSTISLNATQGGSNGAGLWQASTVDADATGGTPTAPVPVGTAFTGTAGTTGTGSLSSGTGGISEAGIGTLNTGLTAGTPVGNSGAAGLSTTTGTSETGSAGTGGSGSMTATSSGTSGSTGL